MERVKLDNKRILFNLLPAHVAQHFLMSNPRNMVSERSSVRGSWVTGLPGLQRGWGWGGWGGASSAGPTLCPSPCLPPSEIPDLVAPPPAWSSCRAARTLWGV